MRTVVGAILAAAVGIHCSVPTEAPATSSPELASQAPSSGGSARAAAPAPESDTSVPKAPDPQLPALDGIVRDPSAVHVTSTAYDATGALFATGTFVGSVTIGDTVIQSRGDKNATRPTFEPSRV